MSGIGFDFISENGLTLMTKYTRDQSKDNKNDSFFIALDYKNSQRSFMQCLLKILQQSYPTTENLKVLILM